MKTGPPYRTVAASFSVFVVACSGVSVSVLRAANIVTGPEQGAQPQVRQFFPSDSFLAYAPAFTGGVRVAAGDVNGDGAADIITGAGPGSSHVKVFDSGTHAELRSFLAYGAFAGGVYVASGDVNADGFSDIVTGTGADMSSPAHVKVFDGKLGGEIRSFLAYGPAFTGGVRVAAGDVNGDGFAEIVTGAGPGAVPHVKVFDGATNAEIRSFLAYGAGFTGGVFVAAGDVNNDGFADIVTGADADAPGGHVKVFSGVDLSEIRSFLAYSPGFTGGVRVAAGDLDGDGFAEIVTGTGPDGGSHLKVFDGVTNAERMSFFAYDPSFTTGIYVAAIPVPEPSTLLVAVCGAIAIALCGRRRRR